ncbi:flagellar biosynthetic protein FliO [Methylomonas lenta]|uniref:Flagellar protein n=1 Tax=Methylomonas lenta TaxID=980561 RepID=A0A177MZU9_9GAMM|nr:flagellar biosynthetic protein FliO [Methylomonas lenta]OAI10813.1 flagellar biosynthetic protein FliO [Methylomonas lenta]
MSKIQLLAICYGCIRFTSTWAEELEVQKQSAKVVSYADVLQWVLALIVVLAIFGIFMWLLRKSGNLSFVNKKQLAIVSGLSLGMREKLVLVKVGEKQLLLGVTPGRVDKLLELEGDSRLFQNQTDAADNGLFAKKLQQVLQGKIDV